MLSELRIKDFAIIDELDLEFAPGLNILTGETGAGKSIIIDAVETILGGRSDQSMIRTEAERAMVEGIFTISPAIKTAVHAILEPEGLLEDPDTLSIAREIRHNGRSIARINGRSVSVSLVAEIGELLVDIHGQSEHLSLLQVRQHLGLLDNYAGVDELMAEYRLTYHRLLDVRKQLAELRAAESESARRMDILTYQINEIEAARLQPGEEEELRTERNRLANAEGLAALVQELILLLDEGSPDSPAASDLLGQALGSIHNLIRLDTAQNSFGDQIELLTENLSELIHNLRVYQEGIEFNPKRLDQVEERLNLINILKRKYGPDIPAVIAFAKQARQQLDAITHVSERIAEFQNEEILLLEQLGKQGEALSNKRRQAALRMESAVERELANLNMDGARLKAEFHRRADPDGVPLESGNRYAFDASGIEKVEFLVAPNPGEGLKPLVKIASGGETSRLMLAIKNVLARADLVPTLIFDEIDQGIGGRVGAVVGRKLWELSRQHQVLCVTHLPQLAAFGEQHLRVRKEIESGRTLTHVQALHGEERLTELAQMMGEVSDGTRQSAMEILEAVERVKYIQ